ncbi:MAG: hypothetical protein ACI8XB_000249 [Patiriisocius sp.]|jgi:hypothetical protein
MIRKHIILLILVSISLEVLAQTIWHEIVSNTTQDLEAIDFVDDNPMIGYIGGDNVILKTIDSGVTWIPITLESVPNGQTIFNVHDIHFLDENHGIATSNATIWETFDGGLNWEYSAVGFNCFAYSLFFLNENISFIGGSGCFEGHVILRIEDGVAIQAMDPDDWAGGGSHVISMNFKDELLGLAGTATGKILRTVDGGFNWDTIPNIANGMAITDFVYEENLIRATHENQDQFGTMVSIDEGLTWTVDWETATFFYPKMFASHKNMSGGIYLGGIEGNALEMGVIFNNQQGFWSWDAIEQPVRDIDSHSDSTTFCVGLNGSIYCNVDPSVINAVDEIEKPLSFEVYPNPANSFLAVSGDIHSNVKYEIFDISGRKVLDGSFGYGSSQRINIVELAAGSYKLNLLFGYQNETYSFQKN